MNVSAQLSATKIDYFSSSQDYLQPLDIVSRWPVFEGARTGSISRDRPTQETATFRRIGWVKKLFRLNCLLQSRQHYAGFCGRSTGSVFVNNTLDPVQSIRRQHNSTKRHPTAYCACARAGNSYGRLAGGGFSQHLGDLGSVSRQDNSFRMSTVHVGSVDEEILN